MVKLTFHYFKELLLLNIGISICLGLLSYPGFKAYGFPISFMTAGYILSLGYYEMSKQKQYYFYYNKGLSKIHLYLSSFMINALIGVLLILIIKVCKIC
jgi:hypothetical protein